MTWLCIDAGHESDPGFVTSPRQVQAPLVDLEVRGVPALSYFGRIVWAETLPDMAAGALMMSPPCSAAGSGGHG